MPRSHTPLSVPTGTKWLRITRLNCARPFSKYSVRYERGRRLPIFKLSNGIRKQMLPTNCRLSARRGCSTVRGKKMVPVFAIRGADHIAAHVKRLTALQVPWLLGGEQAEESAGACRASLVLFPLNIENRIEAVVGTEDEPFLAAVCERFK